MKEEEEPVRKERSPRMRMTTGTKRSPKSNGPATIITNGGRRNVRSKVRRCKIKAYPAMHGVHLTGIKALKEAAGNGKEGHTTDTTTEEDTEQRQGKVKGEDAEIEQYK